MTSALLELGWPGGPGTRFDVLPLVVAGATASRRCCSTLPDDAVLEVPLSHPGYAWFADLGLRWHAVPAISNMCLEIGGICYPAAPFNGWYMGTEIGARNLADADRYDLLPVVAARLGLDTASDRSLWRDRALVELNRRRAALLRPGRGHDRRPPHRVPPLPDPPGAGGRAGRVAPADWSWIVPPISGAATPVFHRYYHTADLRPNYVHHQHADEHIASAPPHPPDTWSGMTP